MRLDLESIFTQQCHTETETSMTASVLKQDANTSAFNRHANLIQQYNIYAIFF